MECVEGDSEYAGSDEEVREKEGLDDTTFYCV